jgi:hypothetical protein
VNSRDQVKDLFIVGIVGLRYEGWKFCLPDLSLWHDEPARFAAEFLNEE